MEINNKFANKYKGGVSMNLYYEESGKQTGPLFVFIHGGGVGSWMWTEQLDYFSHYHCVTIDLPGHGRSIINQTFSIEDISQEILSIIESLRGDKEVIVCGFSIGAQIALQILSQTKTIDYAIINSALVRPQRLLNLMMKPLLPLSFPLAKTKRFSKAQAKALLIPETFHELYERDSVAMTYRILRDTIYENMIFEIPKGLENCPTKTLVTVGEKERRMMKRSADDIVYTMVNATGVTIAGLGHGLPYAKPDLFNHLVQTWLQTGEIIESVNKVGNY